MVDFMSFHAEYQKKIGYNRSCREMVFFILLTAIDLAVIILNGDLDLAASLGISIIEAASAPVVRILLGNNRTMWLEPDDVSTAFFI